MRARRVGLAASVALLAAPLPARADDEDAVSYIERRTEEGDEPDLKGGPVLAGDVRLRAREALPPGSTYESAPPSLQHNVYFYERARVALGPVVGGQLAKRAAVGPALSFENLQEYGTLKGWLELRKTGPVESVVLGNYRMASGQGLLFYDGFGEYVRPALVRARAPRSDQSTGSNDYLRGAAARVSAGPLVVDAFFSEKPLDFPLNSDGSVNANLDDLHEGTGDVQSADAIVNNNTATERLGGGRVGWARGPVQAGVSGYGLRFSRSFDPVEDQFSNARAYRGDGLTLASLDAAVDVRGWRLAVEAARSRASGPGVVNPGGPAWTGTALWGSTRKHFWVSLFDYDPDFVSPHGKGVAFSVSGGPENLPRNQKGGVLGGEWSVGPWSGRANVTVARFPEARGDGSNSGPVAPSQGRYVLLDQRWQAGRDVELRLLFQDRAEDQFLKDPGLGVRRMVEDQTQKWRGAVTWESTPRLRWTLRYDYRLERTRAYGEQASGRMWVADAAFTPRPGTRLKARAYFFNSPEAYLTTGPEEIWDGVVYDRLAGNLGSLRGAPGTRMYFICGQSIGPTRLWAKLEVTRHVAPAEGRTDTPASPRQVWHVQWDGRWGPKL